MKRPLGGLAGNIVGAHAHLERIGQEADGAEAGLDVLVGDAADHAGEVGLCFLLQGDLPGDDILVGPHKLAALDHVAPGNGTVGRNDASQPLLELRHVSLPTCTRGAVVLDLASTDYVQTRSRISLHRSQASAAWPLGLERAGGVRLDCLASATSSGRAS